MKRLSESLRESLKLECDFVNEGVEAKSKFSKVCKELEKKFGIFSAVNQRWQKMSKEEFAKTVKGFKLSTVSDEAIIYYKLCRSIEYNSEAKARTFANKEGEEAYNSRNGFESNGLNINPSKKDIGYFYVWYTDEETGKAMNKTGELVQKFEAISRGNNTDALGQTLKEGDVCLIIPQKNTQGFKNARLEIGVVKEIKSKIRLHTGDKTLFRGEEHTIDEQVVLPMQIIKLSKDQLDLLK